MKSETFVFCEFNVVEYVVQERKRNKIIELTLIAVSRKDLTSADGNILPPLGKLSLLFNPQKNIPNPLAKSTGLSTDFLMNQPIFKDKINTINSFLELYQPVCLVTSNGKKFYKILRYEYEEADASLPDDLLCVDLKSFLGAVTKNKNANSPRANNSLLNTSNASLNTSNLSQAGASDVEDALSASMFQLTTESTLKRETIIPKTYKNLFNKEPPSSERTEVKTMMILECIIATKHRFLCLAEDKCEFINNIEID